MSCYQLPEIRCETKRNKRTQQTNATLVCKERIRGDTAEVRQGNPDGRDRQQATNAKLSSLRRARVHGSGFSATYDVLRAYYSQAPRPNESELDHSHLDRPSWSADGDRAVSE